MLGGPGRGAGRSRSRARRPGSGRHPRQARTAWPGSSIPIPRTIRAFHRLAPPLARLRLLALALDRRLLVEGPSLHFLEDAFLEHVLLERLERRLDLVRGHVDPCRRDDSSHISVRTTSWRGRRAAAGRRTPDD